MKKNIIILLTLFGFFALTNCQEETFMEDIDPNSIGKPSGLVYAEIVETREYGSIRSGVPHVDTDGLVPTYEIISGRDADGNLLDETFMDAVSIVNANLEETPVNYSTAGTIIVAEDNEFGIGEYYFTIKVTTSYQENVYETVFEDVFNFTMKPQLVRDLLYSPIAQNLVVGTGATTTQPYVLSGNPDITFSLGSDTDKLTIDASNGVISLLESYTTVENDTIYPMVNVTSNISGEVTSFQGDSFLMLVASNDVVVLPKKTNYFFYPTLQAENAMFGYKKEIITLGGIAENKVWERNSPANIAADERPESVVGNKSLVTNIVAGGQSLPHESDVIINSQDLTKFAIGYDISTVFYIKNQYVEYLSDGSTPVDLEVYYATDYDGTNNAEANWIQINDQVTSSINGTGEPFVGTPYPGDQKLGAGDPDGRKDTTKNADAKWVRCEFGLNDFKDVKKFTLKFKFNSYFDEAISGATGRGGRFYISDVHFKATEE